MHTALILYPGYPPPDPLWTVVRWAWLFSIVISALFDDHPRRRWRAILVYALATALVSAAAWWWLPAYWRSMPRPWPIVPMVGAIALALAPLHVALGWLVERGSQRLLLRVRQFRPADRCERCGYSLLHLTAPRCPECGTLFDAGWLDPGFVRPSLTARPWRTRATAAIALLLMLATPLIYESGVLAWATLRGRWDAERDWAAGRPVWQSMVLDTPRVWLYAPRPRRLPLRSVAGHEGLLWTLEADVYDTELQLLRRFCYPRSLVECWQRASYQNVIEAKLARCGPPPPPPEVLTLEEAETLARERHSRFELVRELPLRVGSREVVTEDALGISVMADTRVRAWGVSSQAKSVPGIRWAPLPEHNDAVAVLIGTQLAVYDREGRLIQYIDLSASPWRQAGR